MSDINISELQIVSSMPQVPKPSDWKCYLFGAEPGGGYGLIYTPAEGNVPNSFVRWMTKICLGCTWVHGNKAKE